MCCLMPGSGVTWVKVSSELGLVLNHQNCQAAVNSEGLGLRCPRKCWFLLNRMLKKCSDKQNMHMLCFWKKLLHSIKQSVITGHLKWESWSLLHLGMMKKLNAAIAFCFYRYCAALISSHLWRGWMSIPGLYMSRMEIEVNGFLSQWQARNGAVAAVASGWSLRAWGTAVLCLTQLPGLGQFSELVL